MSTSFKIREATPVDVPVLAALHVTTFNETHGPGPTYEIRKLQWEKAFQAKDNDWFCFVVQDENGNLVGFANEDHMHSQTSRSFQGVLIKSIFFAGIKNWD